MTSTHRIARIAVAWLCGVSSGDGAQAAAPSQRLGDGQRRERHMHTADAMSASPCSVSTAPGSTFGSSCVRRRRGGP